MPFGRMGTAEDLVGMAIFLATSEADLDLGEYGPPTVLFQHGEVPEME